MSTQRNPDYLSTKSSRKTPFTDYLEAHPDFFERHKSEIAQRN